MAKNQWKGRVELKGVLKAIEPVKKQDGTETDILQVVIENTKTSGQVEVKVFKKDWDLAKIYDNDTKKMNIVSVSSLTEEQKKRAIKNYIKGTKEEKVYYTTKDFIEDLKKFVGKPIKATGGIEFGTYNDFFQQNINIQKVELLGKGEDYGLDAQFDALFNVNVLKTLKSDTVVDFYVPLKEKKFFKMKTQIPSARYLGGMCETKELADEVLTAITEEIQGYKDGWYLTNVTCEVENSKSERPAQESDLNIGTLKVLQLKFKNDPQGYAERIKKEVEKLGTIQVEGGALNISYIFNNGTSLELVDNPDFYEKSDNSISGAKETSKAQAQAILERAKANKMKANEEAQEKKEETQNESVSQVETAEENNSADTSEDDEFPF